MKRVTPHESGNLPDTFDLKLGDLDGLPDGLKTKPSTIVSVTPIVGNAETFIVQTIRQAEVGDWVFVQHITGKRTTRMVFPPKVANVIASQRDSLTHRNASRVAKRVAQERKEQGFRPFVKKTVKAGKE